MDLLPPQPPLVSAKVAAKRFGFTSDYVSKLCRYGKIAGKKIDSVWYVNESSLHRFVTHRQIRKISRTQALAQERKAEYLRYVAPRTAPGVAVAPQVPKSSSQFSIDTARGVVDSAAPVQDAAFYAVHRRTRAALVSMSVAITLFISFAGAYAMTSTPTIATTFGAVASNFWNTVATDFGVPHRMPVSSDLSMYTRQGIGSTASAVLAQRNATNPFSAPTTFLPATTTTAVVATAPATPHNLTLTINANVAAKQNISVAGAASLQGNTNVGGGITVQGQAAVQNALRVGGNATFGGSVQTQGLLQSGGGIVTNGADINAGTGRVFASNILNAITAGKNITITGTADNPIISSTGSGGQSTVFVGGGSSGPNISASAPLRFDSGSGQLSLQTIPISSGGTGATSLTAGWVYSPGGGAAFIASTSPTVSYVTATSTTATSTFSGGLATRILSVTGSATSTFVGGINITGTGCIARNGVCFSGTGGSATTTTPNINSGVRGQVAYYAANGSTLSATSSLFIAPNGNVGIGTTSPYATFSVAGNGVFGRSLTASSFTATSTTATSTFAAGVNVGSGNGYFIGGNEALSVSPLGPNVGGNVTVGYSNSAIGNEYSSAIGSLNIASSSFSTAIGYGNGATGNSSAAVGGNNTASGVYASAFGNYSYFGSTNIASGSYSSAFGSGNTASGVASAAFGEQNTTSNFLSSAFGISNISSAVGASAFGSGITNSIANSTMVGPSNTAKLTILSTGNVEVPFFTATSTTATSTFSGGLSTRALAVTGAATSTFANGINVTSGCLSQNGVCLSAAGLGGLSSVSATYPITGKGTPTQPLTLAFGTTTANSFSKLQTFTGGATASTITTTGATSTFSGGAVSLGSSGVDTTGTYSVGGTQVLSLLGNGINAGPGNTVFDNASVFGFNNNANSAAFYSDALGVSNTVSNTNASAVGFANKASATYSSAFGYQNTASAAAASAFGSGITNSIANSTMVGPSNTAKLTILSTGNVGIGTTTAPSALSIQNTSNNSTPALTLYDSTGRTSFSIQASTSTLANTFVGVGAGKYNTTGSFNTANGSSALSSNTTGSNNIANGTYALFSNTTGSGNTANGFSALYSNTTGGDNTANGLAALYYNTTGYSNTANGFTALYSNTTGSLNTANGLQALYSNTTGYQNTANGSYALYDNTTGSDNTANGLNALNQNTTGSLNTANGLQALYSNTTGYQNTANGSYALSSNTTGSGNVAVGESAGSGQSPITTFASSTLIGYQAGYDLTTGTANIALGQNVNLPSNTGSNQLNIGNLLYGTGVYGGSTPSSAPAGGKLGIGTTTPWRTLSVAGTSDLGTNALAGSFTATSTTATSTFSGGLSTRALAVTGAATSTLANGINVTSGCLSQNGVCITAGGLGGVTAIGPIGQTQKGPTITLATSTLGTDFTITGTGSTLTFNLPSSSATSRGLLAPAAYTHFNDKIGSSTIAALTANAVPAWNGSALANSALTSVGGNVGIGTTTPGSLLALGITNGINFGTATSTFNSTGGINLAHGCYALGGVCLSAAGLGGLSSVSATYPITGKGTPTQPLTLAFGTTTANSFSKLQTFTGGATTTGLTVSGAQYLTPLAAPAGSFLAVNAQGKVIATSSPTGGVNGIGTVTSVAATVPTGLTITGSPITTSGTLAFGLQSGYIIPLTASTTNWNTAYNTVNANSANWNTAYTDRITSASAPLSIASNAISISQANSTTNGYLSSTDWNTFNNKQSALSTTWPITLTGSTLGFNGISTSTPVSVASGLTYWTGANTVSGTTSPTVGYITATSTNTSNFGGSINIATGNAYQYGGINILTAIPSIRDTFVGAAGNLTMTGADNVGVGANALQSNTTGYSNVAIGSQALSASNSLYNVAVGTDALQIATTSSYNVAIGANSLQSLQATGAGDNVAIGYQTLNSDTTGIQNVALGSQALKNNISGSGNMAIGRLSLFYNTTGNSNVGVGNSALEFNQSGNYNTAIGQASLFYNTTGYWNVANGFAALNNNTTGSDNVALGSYALLHNTSATTTVAIGYGAAQGTTSYHSQNGVYIGHASGINVQNNSNNNTFIGYQSGKDLTTGSYNILLGSNIDAPSNTASQQLNLGNLLYGTGVYGGSTPSSAPTGGNVGIGTTTPWRTLSVAGTSDLGTNALAGTFTATSTTATSQFAGNINLAAGKAYEYNGVPIAYGDTTNNNYFFGNAGNTSMGGQDNAFVGNGAGGLNGSGYQNIALGSGALAANTSGPHNSALGYFTLNSNVTGDENVAVGGYSLRYNVSGNSNTAVGNSALYNTTGSSNTALGNSTGLNITTGSNNIIIGASVGAPNPSGSQQLNLGNVLFGTGIYNGNTQSGVPVATGKIGIGTTTPWRTLSVAGTSDLGTNALAGTFTATSTTATSQFAGNINLAAGKAYEYNGVPIAYGDTTNNNYFFGNAGNTTTTGNSNTAGGVYALASNTSGSENTSFGYHALRYNSGGNQNTATGRSALNSNTTGNYNTSNGYGSLFTNTTGSSNSAIGLYALFYNTTGSANVAVGNAAGSGAGGTFSTSFASSTLLGYQAGYSLTTGTANIALGQNVDLPNSTGSNQLNIGNLIYGTGVYGGATPSSFPTTGKVGIGTTSPETTLTVVGAICAARGAGVQTTACGTTAGAIYANSSSLTGGYDVAETYPTLDTALSAGDVVAFDPAHPGNVLRASDSSASFLGVVSSHPGLTLGVVASSTRSIAMIGRVPVKFSTQNGAIGVGDRLTVSSTTPGIAVKLVGSGSYFGQALEPSTNATSTLMAFINPGYYAGNISLAPATSTTPTSSGASLTAFLQSIGASVANGILHISSLVADTISATRGFFGSLTTGTATIGTAAHPTGITLYDTATNEPYCLSIVHGVPTSTPGTCQTTSPQTTSPQPSPSAATPLAITVNGSNPTYVPVGATYTDAGATVTGGADNGHDPYRIYVSGSTTATSSPYINTRIPATYTLTYTVTDSANVTKSAHRQIVVGNANGMATSTTPAPTPSYSATSTSSPSTATTTQAQATSTAAIITTVNTSSTASSTTTVSLPPSTPAPAATASTTATSSPAS